MSTYTVSEGQTLEDIALEVYGNVDGVATILAANPALYLGQALAAGLEVKTPGIATSPAVATYYRTRQLRANAGVSYLDITQPPPRLHDIFFSPEYS